MLLLLAGFWIVQTGSSPALQFVEQKVEVVADLATRRAPTDVQTLEVRVAAMPEVAGVTYVSKDEALQRFREAREAQGAGGPHGVPRRQPAARQPRGEAPQRPRLHHGDDVLAADPAVGSGSGTSRTRQIGC